MSQSLNNLPDLCLLAVFQYLSLLELLRTIRLVSTRWSSLLPTELNRRRSLVIVDDRTFNLTRLQLDQHQSHLIEHVKRDDALTPWARLSHIDQRNVINRENRYTNDDDGHRHLHNQVQPEMITTLIGRLPHISCLTVVQRFYDLTALDQIIRMIDYWRGHLVSLKIYMKLDCFLFSVSNPDDYKAQLKASTLALFDSINRSTSLKHLSLKLDSFFQIDHPFEPSLTILSQLSTFHIESIVLHNYPTGSLVRYVSGNRDLQIATVDYELQLEDLLKIDQQFCDRFIDIEVDVKVFDDETIPDFTRFCIRFSSLVHLTLTEYNLPMTRLAQCLSKLNQLVHLNLNVFTYPFFDGNDELALDELSLDQIVPVQSVRLLSLTLNTKSHNSAEKLHLPELFPNVQVFSLRNVTEECPDCGFFLHQLCGRTVEITVQLRRCAQLARRPFRRFPRLHTIEIDAKDSAYLSTSPIDRKFITIDEL